MKNEQTKKERNKNAKRYVCNQPTTTAKPNQPNNQPASQQIKSPCSAKAPITKESEEPVKDIKEVRGTPRRQKKTKGNKGKREKKYKMKKKREKGNQEKNHTSVKRQPCNQLPPYLANSLPP